MMPPDAAFEMRGLATSASALARAAGADVVLDLPRSRHLSVGMRAYAEEVVARAPALAGDLRFTTVVRRTTASVSEQLVLPGVLARLRGRLVHHLSPYVPACGPMPFVVTVHDLIHLRYPQYFKNTVAWYYDAIVRRACAAAARVIVDDERTIRDLALYLDVDPAKVVVIPLGVDDAFHADSVAPYEHRRAGGPARPYLLYAGNHREHKDLPTLFAAWASLPESLELDLLLTGPDDFAGVPRPWRRGSTMRALGTVERDRLPALYAGATALVQPSLCEGFGLPVVEAAALGTRVFASAEAVPAALAPHVGIFEPRDHRALAALIRSAPDASALAAARAAARALTWDRCIAATVEVYRDVLAQTPA